MVSVFHDNNNYDNMFAHLRSKQAKQDNQANQSKQDRLLHLATTMRDSVRRHMHPLIQIDQHNHPEFAAPLAEIYMREFACMLQTLKQVNWIASKYHEHAFDNTDAYIEGQRPLQLSPHEMTAEQRHASQILLGVGNNYSEINVALKTLDCNISMKDVMECEGAMIEILAQEFRNDSRLPEDAFDLPEDAFDRLHHMTKQVWSLVNMLAFSNLFRFADPAQPILIANPEDSIFIPHIPMQPLADESIWCYQCAARTNAKYHEIPDDDQTVHLCPTCFLRDSQAQDSHESDEYGERYWLKKELDDWTESIRKKRE